MMKLNWRKIRALRTIKWQNSIQDYIFILDRLAYYPSTICFTQFISMTTDTSLSGTFALIALLIAAFTITIATIGVITCQH